MSKYSIKDSNTGKPDLIATIKAFENELGVCFNYRETNIISEHFNKLKTGNTSAPAIAFLKKINKGGWIYLKEIHARFRKNDLSMWEFWYIETLL